VLVQHGTASPPRAARGVAYLPREELLDLMGRADVVVAQGGPASVVETRGRGRVPLVVPRVARHGEVVDDHQVTYSRHMAAQQQLLLAETADQLWTHLDAALADPSSVVAEPDPERDRLVAANSRRLARVVDEVTRRALPARRPTVVLLGGLGRSGSTLVERVVGGVPGVRALGEVIHLWERGVGEDQLCGCGEPFGACPFWREVGERAFGGWHRLDAAEVLEDRYGVVRNRFVPGLLLTPLRTARRLRTRRLVRRLDALYAAAASDGSLLVDSSKHPAYAFLLRRCRVDLRVVLVVRDPRGTAWSWRRTVTRPEVVGEEATMPLVGVVPSALRWDVYSLLVLALRALRVPVLVLRYEDFVADPAAGLRSVLAHAGAPVPEVFPHVRDGVVDLAPEHTVAGNPMRFRTGAVPVTADERWRAEMPRRDRLLVSLLTAPVRPVLGYGRSVRRRSARPSA
jgi:UDP-N-acetylglucosamine transferase subunit ALG13